MPGLRCRGERGAAGREPRARPRDDLAAGSSTASRPEAEARTRRRGTVSTEGAVHGPAGLQGHQLQACAGGRKAGTWASWLSAQRGDLPGVAEPVLLGAAAGPPPPPGSRTCRRRSSRGRRSPVGQHASAPAAGPATGAHTRAAPGEGLGAGPRGASGQAPCSPWAAAALPGCPAPDQVGAPGPRCSPRRPSGAATRRRQAAGRGPVGSDRALRLCPQARPGWSPQVGPE